MAKFKYEKINYEWWMKDNQENFNIKDMLVLIWS